MLDLVGIALVRQSAGKALVNPSQRSTCPSSTNPPSLLTFPPLKLPSGIPITAIGLDLTLRVLLEERAVRRIAQAEDGVGALLEDQILRYWEHKQIKANHPHDPLATLAMVRPDLFVFETWGVEVASESRIEGLTRLVESKAGNIRIGFDVLSRTAEREIVRRIAGKPKP